MAKSVSTCKMAILNYPRTITTSHQMNAYITNQASLNLNKENIYRVMVANKFYDFGGQEYHMTLIEEKKCGTHMM